MSNSLSRYWLAGAVFLVSLFEAVPSAAFLPPTYAREGAITSGLSAPTAVAVGPRGRVYVTESSLDRLHVFDKDGELLRTLEGLARPISVTVGRKGKVYIGNAADGSVDIYGRRLKFLGQLGDGKGEFGQPSAIALDRKGRIYVTDSKENVVKVYHRNGTLKRSIGGSDEGYGFLQFPTSVAVDRNREELVVVDLQSGVAGEKYSGARIQIFSLQGERLRDFGGYGVGEELLVKPLGMAIDGRGHIFVTDAYQNVVQVFTRGGTYLTAIYDPEQPLRTPLGIAHDAKRGRLYVASLAKRRIDVFRDTTPPPATLAVTLCGQGDGAVVLEPWGETCHGACSYELSAGTVVTLVPEASEGSVFKRWRGDCKAAASCELAVERDASVKACFAPLRSGSGTLPE